jgi:hypothetical protein
MSTDQAATATVERREDAEKDDGSAVKLWLDAIGIATSEEQNWRKAAQSAFDLYRQSGDVNSVDGLKKFNILHANVETICPALYNSSPVPDVRRRFGDEDPVAKTVSDIQERCLSYSIDRYDFDHLMRLAVKDHELAGRAVTRVRYKPYLSGEEGEEQLADQEVVCEHVEWKHFRRGPAHIWDETPWIAFEHFFTRDQLEKLSPKFGSKVSLDVSINRPDDKTEDRNIPEIFKRARVWEIWDKDQRKVLFIAESFKDGPIREEDDPLQLEGFYPIPRPLYAITTSNSLIPVVPYDIYKAQAEELEIVSARILALTEAVKPRSIYDARMTEMDRLESADDAESIPIENVAIFADGSKLEDHVMYMPLEKLTAALEKLYLARDQIKATIYEITGISDIIRGATDPNETLGAQQMKAGSSNQRIQTKQQEIQRYARDLFGIKAEIFASKFEPQYLEMMTGIPLVPNPQDPPEAVQHKQAVMQMLRSDKRRGFRVDVETNSTIRADLQRHQQTMGMFLEGTAKFGDAMGPFIATYKGAAGPLVKLYAAFARDFDLGRSAEDALEELIELAENMAKQPDKPDPQMQVEQMKAQVAQQKAQIDMTAAQQKHQAEMQMMQAKLAMAQEELRMKEQELQLKAQEAQLKAAASAQQMQIDSQAQLRDAEHEEHMTALAMQRGEREHELGMEEVETKHTLGLETMKAKAKQAKQPGARR